MGSITSPDSSVTIGYSSPNITLQVAGGGDVVGPASSTDGDLAVFDGLTGKLLKDTGISSTAPTFVGNVTSQTRVIAPFDNKTGLAEGFFFSDGTVAARQVGSALANYFFGNSGNSSMTGIANTGVGQAALASLTSGIQNTAQGNGALLNLSSGSSNSGFGYFGGAGITTSTANTACGYGVLSTNPTVGFNNGFGFLALQLCSGNYNNGVGCNALQNCTGNENTAIGHSSGSSITTGAFNTLIGSASGLNYTSSESNNILIGRNVLGTALESDTIRIGGTQTRNFQAGIAGVTVASSAAVLIDTTTGQLGTVVSSERYKENIVDMPKDISVMNLRPVQFTYKTNNENEVNNLSYGLIAEEVDRVFPYLCIHKDGQPETVKYHELCVFLLAEIQRLEKRVNTLEAK